MRLTFIISSMEAGGAERILTTLANSICARGHEVTLITTSNSERDYYELVNGVERIRLNIYWQSRNIIGSVLSTFKRMQMIRHAVRDAKPDVVLSFIDTTNIRVPAALLGTGIPVVVSERIDPTRFPIGRLWNWLRRMLYPLSSKVVVQTDSVYRWASKFLKNEKISIIPNFVSQLESGREKPELLANRSTIIAAGRLATQKGFDILINAFSQSGLASKGWQVIILGAGDERIALEAQINEYRMNDCIILPGLTSNIKSWFEHADIFVLSSRFEGFPNVLLEAMSCGLPCVAFDCPSGPSEIIEHMSNGLLLPPENAKELSDALQKLASDQEFASKLSEEAKKISDKYSVERITDNWINLFSDVKKK